MNRKSMAAYLPDFTGSLVDAGRYELVQLLGAGACGVVYRAFDLQARPRRGGAPVECAVKIIKKAGPLKSDTARQRREIHMHRLVSDHPNVLTVHDAFEDERFYYLVMDFCSGGDLFSMIADDHAFDRNDDLVRRVFVQILDAVEACHKRHVFHRDLKPENILCSKDGSAVYLADFGLATDRRFSCTFGCGSQHSLDLECIGGEFSYRGYSTPHNDIWSLGIILANMLSGCSPWELASTVDPCFAEFLRDEHHFEVMMPISRPAGALLQHMLALNPFHRPPISAIRRAVLEMETFFMSDDDIARGTVPMLPEQPHIFLPSPLVGGGNSVLQDNVYCEEPVEDMDIYQPDVGLIITTAEEVDLGTVNLDDDSQWGSACTSPLTSASTSGGDSDGPATPGVYACEPQLVFPELPEEESLGEALVLLPPRAPLGGKEKETKENASPAPGLLDRLEMIVLA